MRITSKGQITIPIEIRERLGLWPETEVEFAIKGNAVLLQKAVHQKKRGRAMVEHLRGRGSVKMSTDEIMALTRGE